MAISIVIVSSLLYFAKKQKSNESTFNFGILIFLSLFLVLRSNPTLTFINIVASMFFLSELLLKLDTDSLLYRLYSPIIAVTTTLTQKLDQTKTAIPRFSIDRYFKALIISFLVLIVIIPLLASSNPIFNSLVKTIFDFEILNKLLNENLALNILRFIIFIVLLFLLPRAISLTKKASTIPVSEFERSLFQMSFSIPKTAVITVLSVFLITQLQLYFSSEATLLAMGYTNSEYTREVFGQLSVVTLITFLLIYFDRAKTSISKITSSILLVQMAFLTSMALKSVYDYTSQWGYTLKRLYGYAVVYWLFALLLVFTYYYLKEKSYAQFLRWAVALTGITIILINLVNFDKLIYYKSQSVTHHGTDYSYLSTLSSDSGSIRDQITTLKAIQKDPQDPNEVSGTLYFLENKVSFLQRKYMSIDWRAFNLSEYQEYLSVKDYDTSHINSYTGTRDDIPEPSPDTIPDGSVKITILGLPYEFYGNAYFLTPFAQSTIRLHSNNFSGKLIENSLVIPAKTGTQYLYLVNEKRYYNHYTLTTTEIPIELLDSDISRKQKSISY